MQVIEALWITEEPQDHRHIKHVSIGLEIGLTLESSAIRTHMRSTWLEARPRRTTAGA
jgi:hypothetical protein